jgi:hypothetical protein
MSYEFHKPETNSIVLNNGTDEMLRIAPDGFYVRGEKVPADQQEAAAIYHAFKQWLMWANLQRDNQ